MNYSENMTYGRKEVHRSQRSIRQKTYQEKILKLLIGTLVVGIILGSIGTTIVFKVSSKNNELQAAKQDVLLYGQTTNQFKDRTVEWTSSVNDFTALNVDMDEDLQEFIFTLSKSYKIDFAFTMALIWQESRFQNVESSTNDFGLMQINKINHEWLTERFGVTDFLDPYQNTRAGLHILRSLFDKYEDPSKVLMAYNLGENGARKLWDKGINETGYSVSVLNKTAEFNAELERKNEND